MKESHLLKSRRHLWVMLHQIGISSFVAAAPAAENDMNANLIILYLFECLISLTSVGAGF